MKQAGRYQDMTEGVTLCVSQSQRKGGVVGMRMIKEGFMKATELVPSLEGF